MRNDKPLVSVIMPCYNHAKYVGKAIESVLNQTYDNIELLVADNGSTDNSYEVIQQYQDKITKIIRLKKNKQMYCGTCLRREAKGQYIAIMTSDDYWEKDKLELQMQVFANNPEIKACTTWIVQTDENLQPLENQNGNVFGVENRSRYEWFRHFILRGNCLAWPTGVIETETYDRVNAKLRGYKQIGDMYFWAHLVQEADVYVVPKELVRFRWHAGGNNGNESAHTQPALIRVWNETADFVDNILESVDDEFFKEAFRSDFIYPDSQTHEEITCEKCFLLKRMAEKDSIYQPYVLRYFFRYFMECRDVFEEKYQFTYQALHDWSATVGVAKIRRDSDYMINTALQELSRREQMLQSLKQLLLEELSDNVDVVYVKRKLFQVLSVEKQKFIEEIRNVIAQGIISIEQAIATEHSEVYAIAIEVLTNVVHAIDSVWGDLVFAEFDVSQDDWNVYKELVSYAGQEQIDLSEAVLPFTQYIEEQIRWYFEEN